MLVEIANDPLDALSVPATRSYLIFGVIMNGAEPDVGSCVADEVLAATPLEVLSDPDPDPDALAELQSSMMSSMQKCAAADA